jgi:putative tryptophan/tyrosine transport system substrate-binding protein
VETGLPGWAGRHLGINLRIDYRWAAGDADLYRRYAAELVALAPDAVLAVGGTAVGDVQEASHTVLIVFVNSPIQSGAADNPSSDSGNLACFRGD